MNTITYSGYCFTVNSSYTLDNVNHYNVAIESPEMLTATGIITECQGAYHLLDMHFVQAVGLNGIFLFIKGLKKIADEVLPLVVNTCKDSPEAADVNVFNAIAQITRPL